jgi:CDP-diacylglycerol--serine O-phosphatidyltransferase
VAVTAARAPLRRRVVVVLPNGFTLANLFFGIFAIVTASRGDYSRACWYIMFGAFCDAFDGRVARATNSGSKFGEELDSLVDAISFGLAPAMIAYFAVLRHQGWDWVLVFLFAACAVIRLARFNVESAGDEKEAFIGLPSPAAGGTLATYYWFSQTDLYRQTFVGDLPWGFLLRVLMAALAFLMISNVPYPAWPRFNVRTARGILGLTLMGLLLVMLIVLPKEFFFPLGIFYVSYGVLRASFLGLLERPVPAGDADPLDDDDAGFADDARGPRLVADDPPRRRRRRGRDPRRPRDLPPLPPDPDAR